MNEETRRTIADGPAVLNGHRVIEPVEFEVVYGNIHDIRRTRWAWEGWIPLGALTIVAGEPGAGKGVFTSWLLAHLSRGTLPGDLFGDPSRILWVGFEDSWEEVVLPRLQGAGADISMIGHLRATDHAEMLDLARDHDHLHEIVEEQELRVVVFEALVDHLAGTDDHKNAEVRRALTPLVGIARERHAVVLGTTHLNKTTTGSYRQRVSGSGGYLAVARVGLLVHPHPEIDEERVVAHGKGNLGRVPDSVAFEIQSADVTNHDGSEIADVGVMVNEYPDSSLTVDEVLAGGKDNGSTKEDEVVAFLRRLLVDGPVPSGEVNRLAAERKLGEKILRKYRDEAGAETYQWERAWWWRLKGQNAQTDEPRPSEPSEPSEAPDAQTAPLPIPPPGPSEPSEPSEAGQTAQAAQTADGKG